MQGSIPGMARYKKNRKVINSRIYNHKWVFHGVPLSAAQQPKKSKLQPIGEGRWIKPVESIHVEAQWYPKTSSASTTTWVPITYPPTFIH